MACSTSRLRRAYPRGRGGAVAMVRMGRMPSGLSPRTRGSPIIPIVAIIALVALGIGYATKFVEKDTFVRWAIGIIIAGSAAQITALFFS